MKNYFLQKYEKFRESMHAFFFPEYHDENGIW